jgi:FixJ family two-component response regulator
MPIVLATGYAELPAGAHASMKRLAKPFTMAQLAEIVSAAVQSG